MPKFKSVLIYELLPHFFEVNWSNFRLEWPQTTNRRLGQALEQALNEWAAQGWIYIGTFGTIFIFRNDGIGTESKKPDPWGEEDESRT